MLTLTSSMEDYLEAIFEIEKYKRAVRVKDVAKRLGVTMPSVNGALKNLEEKGLIKHEKYEYIELTSKGTLHASRVSSRHHVIRLFLKDFLGVDAEIAEEDECKMEHVLSATTMKKLEDYVQKRTKKTI